MKTLLTSACVNQRGTSHRQTFACWSLAAGANPNYVAAQMGHANSQMVYLVYGAWMHENNDEQVSLINSKLADVALHMPYRKASSL